MDSKLWNECTDVYLMMSTVQHLISTRKLMLFGVACCRMMDNIFIGAHMRRAINLAEEHADNIIDFGYLEEARLRITNEDSSPITSFVSTTFDARSAILALLDKSPVAAAIGSALYSRRAILSDLMCAALSSAEEEIADQIAKNQADIMRDIYDDLYTDTVMINDTITGIADTIYWDRDYTLMPILGDALEDAGCTDKRLLSHCRSGQRHYRGCWAIDEILRKS